MKIIAFLFTAFISLQAFGQEKFPDGTPIPDWFRQNEIVNIETLGQKYTITDYGVVNDSTILQTEKIQAVIDRAARNGGGGIVVPLALINNSEATRSYAISYAGFCLKKKKKHKHKTEHYQNKST